MQADGPKSPPDAFEEGFTGALGEGLRGAGMGEMYEEGSAVCGHCQPQADRVCVL